MSYLSRRCCEIRNEEYWRTHPVYDFKRERVLLGGRWRDVERLPEATAVRINYWGRAG